MSLSVGNYRDAFESQLTRAQKIEFRKLTKFYNEQSDKAIELALNRGVLSFSDVDHLFKSQDLQDRYTDLYVTVGMRFANWYFRNINKYINKGLGEGEIWEQSFRHLASQIAGARITLVQGTARKQLVKTIRAMYATEGFVTLGANERARMLRKKFKGLNKFQAERIARTESIFAANYGTTQSAKSLFPDKQLVKEWIHSKLDNARQSHIAMDGKVVEVDKPFIVNGEFLMEPGDPTASASNVINCRCSSAKYPMAEPEQISTGVDIGKLIATGSILFDLAQAE